MPKQQLPNDIYSLTGYGVLWYEWLFVIGGVLFVLALLYGLVKWSQRKKARPDSAPKSLSPFEYWRRRIRQLNMQSPFGRPAQVEFYYELSLAVRSGIEAATGLRATDLTYKELRAELKKGAYTLPVDEQELLKFLNKADYVKFADRDSTVEQGEADREQTLSWLERLESYHQQRTMPEVASS